jgi:SAM-dependent MidA family methyltransferase
MSQARRFLLELQRELGGTIPFDRFMAEALHHPAFGYYATRIRGIGPRGDFSTFSTLGAPLARPIADWIRSTRQRHIVEIGAGNGKLARSVLRELGFAGRLARRYHIVESSPRLRAAQEKELRGFRIQWHATPAEALAATGNSAAIFSNELPDAFPCRIFEKTATGEWHELHLELDPIRQSLRPAPLPDSTAFTLGLPPGSRIEVHDSYRQWLAEWLPAFHSGAMLTIDYGSPVETLYHRRPQGTLRGYALHQRLDLEEILAAPGLADITADVNFTDLAAWGNELGLETLSETSLSDFLGMPTEAAGAFRVLQQAPRAIRSSAR